VDREEEWHVERVLDEKKEGTRKLALLKWVSYATPTWEPLANVRDTEAWKHWTKSRRHREGPGGGRG